jgi:hypothetical protein
VRPLHDAAEVSTRSWFYALLVVLTITLVVIGSCEPIVGDSWGHHFAARTPFSWHRLAMLADTGYYHGNPRWGQLVLATMFYAPTLAAIVSALVIVALLLLSMTLIRARFPRASEPADAWLLVQVLATAIATTPQFGAIWFYRPNCANYVYPLCVQLAWLVPYRFVAARRAVAPWWLVVAIIPLGVLAGAGNEHTGVGLAVAAGACTYIAWCRDRALPAWTIAGIAALLAGYVALLAAPGQLVRYGGVGAQQSFVERIADRGVIGNVGVLALFVAWLSPMLIVVGIIASRRVPSWRFSSRAIAGFVAIAAVMVATALAAPRVPARLLVAPATMVALALGVFMIELATHREKARALRAVSLAISGVALAVCLAIFVVTGIEGRARVRQIETAPAGAVICVAPYTFSMATPFSWGDDFRSPIVVDRVARMYKLGKIERDCR